METPRWLKFPKLTKYLPSTFAQSRLRDIEYRKLWFVERLLYVYGEGSDNFKKNALEEERVKEREMQNSLRIVYIHLARSGNHRLRKNVTSYRVSRVLWQTPTRFLNKVEIGRENQT